MNRSLYQCPLGSLELFADDEGVTCIRFPSECDESSMRVIDHQNRHLRVLADELDLYFSGKLKEFTCKLNPSGTPFQLQVWAELQRIPYGSTATYGQIASKIGNEKASRAVGGANNQNPMPIVIPCHRVVGSNNTLVGYAGELWRKEWLLEHEGVLLPVS